MTDRINVEAIIGYYYSSVKRFAIWAPLNGVLSCAGVDGWLIGIAGLLLSGCLPWDDRPGQGMSGAGVIGGGAIITPAFSPLFSFPAPPAIC
ncbi:hypothetical protein [Sphingobium aquiterrae]|uniref:hypothetical protein n=1 Tax=Sphingobium aquiterrae TaxID=2038656 RepID=UPI0030159BD6